MLKDLIEGLLLIRIDGIESKAVTESSSMYGTLSFIVALGSDPGFEVCAGIPSLLCQLLEMAATDGIRWLETA